MASTVPSSSTLSLSNPKLFSRIPFRRNLQLPPHPHLTIPRATETDGATEDEKEKPAEPSGDDFDNRLSQMRLRYKSGQGKKAEVRKTKKGAKGSAAASSGSGLYLPPVKLKQPVSEGLNVEFGFSPYSEKVNGRMAAVGLTALVLVELATGQSVIKFHSPAIIFIQMYFMAAASAVYIKYEKERVSVWPPSISSQE